MLLYILHLLKLIQYSSIYIKFIIVFLLIRFIHRIWWQIDGHKYQPFLDPHEELSRFLSSIIDKDNNDNIDYSKEYTFNSKDNVILKYHKIGNGNKKILLLNGVGTGLFMWVPVFVLESSSFLIKF